MLRSRKKQITPAKRLRYRLEAGGLALLARVVPLFPRGFVRRAGRALGWWAYYAAPGLRRIARTNLDLAFGDARTPREKSRIARASIQNFAATVLCLFWSPRVTRENFRQFVELDEQAWRRALAVRDRGRGVLFITLHYGDWELLGLVTAYLGVPLVIVQENMRNQALEEIFSRFRSVSGHRLVPQRLAATRLIHALRHGESSAMLVDLNTTRRGGGLWLDFFGLKVFSSPAVAALAMRSGAAIVAGAAHPLPDGRMRLVFGPEITITPTGDHAADLRALSQQCLSFCEQTIRAAPEHWLWSYKRWSPRPSPEQGRYPWYSRFIRLPVYAARQTGARGK